MIVGIATLTLRIPGNRSLKGKRGVVRSLLGRVRQRFNVSISEVAEQDALQRTVLGVSCVSNASDNSEEQLNAVVRFVESEVIGEAEMVDCRIEVLSGFDV